MKVKKFKKGGKKGGGMSGRDAAQKDAPRAAA